MGGIFGGGNSYAGGGQEAYSQQQPSFPGYDYPYVGNNYVGVGSADYGGGGGTGGGDYGAYTSYGSGMGSPTDPGAGYYDTGGGGTAAGGGGGILDWLGSEKGQRALQQLGGFSSGMLAGSAPSLQPRGFSTALAGGMQGFQQAGSQYYQDALHRAQSEKAVADAANLKASSALLAGEAQNATGLPPGYTGMPPVGQIPPAAAAAPGGDAKGTGPFSQIAPIIAKYESGNRHNIGWGGTDLSGVPLSETGFPQWGGKPGPAGNSTAAGLYQITRSTWDPIARELGIKDFSPESQYKVAEALYQRRGLAPWAPYNQRLAQALGRGEAGEAGVKDPALQVRLPIPSAPGATPAQRLADTPFQMPSNMAAGLNVPIPGGIQVGGGAPVPGVMQPQPGPLATALRPPVAPSVTIPQTAVAGPAAPGEPVATSGSSAPAAAARVAVAGAPNLTEGDSIAYGFQKYGGLAGNPKGGRNPEQVLQNIGSNLERDPDYYRGKTVILSSGVMNGAKRIDLVPEQIKRIQDAGGKVILTGVDTGKFAGHNSTLQQMAADAGVPFAGALPTDNVHPGPDGYRQYLARVQRGAARVAGAAPPVVDVGQAASAGGGGEGAGDGGTPAPVVGAGPPAPPPAVVSPSPPPPAPAGTMAPGGALALPPAATVAGAPVAAAPALARGTAAGMPVVPPEPLPPPPVIPATPAPAPGAMATPQPGAASVMPGAIAPPAVAVAGPPPPVPNLGQVAPPGMGGIPAYNVEAARRAQVVANALAMAGRPVPAHIAELAAMPNKAVEAQWAQQKELYGQQLQAARDQWKSLDESQKAAVAAQNGLTKSGYESELRTREDNLKQGRWFNPQTQSFQAIPGAAEVAGGQAGAVATAQQEAQRQRELDTPVKYDYLDENKIPRTTYLTPRQLAAGAVPGQLIPPSAAPPSVVPGAVAPAPAPGAATPAGGTPAPAPGAIAPQGAQTSLSVLDTPQQYKTIGQDGKPFEYTNTPRFEAQGIRPPGVNAPGSLLRPTGLAPGVGEEQTGAGKELAAYRERVFADARAAEKSRSDLDYLSALGPNIASPGPFAEAAQTFNRVRASVLGTAVEPVASYEVAQQIMGSTMRQALRQNDPNPTERQQQMMIATFPTPSSSAEGFQQGIRQMQGIADYQVFKREALQAWLNDPAHNNSAAGFESSFKISSMPFVLDRMSDEQQTQYLARLHAKDPRALQRLNDQIDAVKNLNYTYKY